MKSRLAVLLIFSLALVGIASSATAQESFYEETFSLYGYIVNFFNANLYADDWRITGSDYGNILYGRLKGDWNPGDNLSFHMELDYNASVGNLNPGSTIQSASVDHLWGSVNLGRFDIQFGKLPIAWGAGYFFNPTSKATTIPFLESVSEETPGTVGIVPGVSFLDGYLSIQGYVALQDRSHSSSLLGNTGNWSNLPFGVKLNGIIGSFDVSAGWIKEVFYNSESDEFYRRHYGTADFAGAIWNFGVYGEAALKTWDESQEKLAFEYDPFLDLLDACVGFDYFIPIVDIDARMEYFHQGSGVTDPGKYEENFAKLISGEQLVLAEDYVLIYLERSFLDYFSISTTGFVNINDGSLGVFPELSGEPYGNFLVGLGAMLFLGDEGSEFDMQDPAVYLRCKLSF